MDKNFNQTLEHIADQGTHLNRTVLYGLSMLDKSKLAKLETLWPNIKTDRRQHIMRQLVEITELNFEVNFDPIFIMALNDQDTDVQASAIKGLWENESPTLIPPFIYLLREGKHSKVRAAAATALGQFLYLAELGEIDENAQLVVEQALLETIRRSGEAEDVVRRAIEAIAFSHREGIDEIIEYAYYHDDELMQVSAIFAMGRSYNSRWADIVLKELENDNPAIRFEAARACGELVLQDAVAPLMRLIKDDADSEVQQNAIWALGQIGGPAAQEKLEELAEADNEALRTAAEEALDELTLMGDDLGTLFNFAMDMDDYSADDDEFGLDTDVDYETFNLN